MINWIAAALLVVFFLFLIKKLRLVENSRTVIGVARRSGAVISSSTMSDDAKELALRSDLKHLLRLFILIVFGWIAGFFIPLGLLWLCDMAGLLSMDSVHAVLFSPVFIAVSSVFIVLFMYLSSVHSVTHNNYSAIDRIIHKIAFNTYNIQVALAEIEDTIYKKKLLTCPLERPVFITALPRAGTTLLLECCTTLNEFASHNYRDMPFVLIPCLWNTFSAPFQKSGELKERAHKDGMLIGFESFEAFEEVVWKTFWKEHYQKNRILPWTNENNSEFNEFFSNHIQKIICLRSGADAGEVRYISKNNLNISRTAYLKQIFPDSIIIVPFREPLQHANSLLKQHQNFLKIHKDDAFASEYMRAIGHYDFGENLRPVDFDGWISRHKTERDPFSLSFWLEYWVVSYRALLSNAGSLRFFSYEALCEEPERGLQLLSFSIESKESLALQSNIDRIKKLSPVEVELQNIPGSLIKEANNIYARLRELSIV